MNPGVRAQRNAAALFGEKIVSIGAVAAVNVVVLRSLGPTEYGYLSSATAILAIVLPLTLFGQSAIVKLLVERSYATKSLARSAWIFSATGSVTALVILVILGLWVVPTRSGSLVLILAVSLLARPWWSAADAIFQAQRKNSISAAVRTAGSVTSSCLRLGIALSSGSLDLLAIALVSEHFIVAIGFGLLLRRQALVEPAPSMPGDGDSRRDIFALAWPQLAYGISVILFMRVDQPMLLWLSDPRTVGLYAAAANISDSASLLTTVLTTVLLPSLIALNQRNRRAFEARGQEAFLLSAGLGYLVTVFGVAFAGPAVRILYGPEYAETAKLLAILVCGCPFLFVGYLRVIWMLTDGLQREVLLSGLLALIVNVGLNIWLVPRYGAEAAATTTVIAHAVNGVFGNALFRRTRPIFRMQLRALNPFRSLPVVAKSVWTRKL